MCLFNTHFAYSYLLYFCQIGALLANKIDLDQRRVISPKAGKELAQSNKLEYFECSAVSYIRVNEIHVVVHSFSLRKRYVELILLLNDDKALINLT